MAIYAVSDLHGYYDLFLQGLDMIGFSSTDKLWVLGDAIDRGPDGIKILQHIRNSGNMDLLIGNHELMMLHCVDPEGRKDTGGYDMSLWLSVNGGSTTYEQYSALTKDERKGMLDWLSGRYVIKLIEACGKKFCLTHSFYSKKCEDKRFYELDYYDVCNVVWSSIWRDDEHTKSEDIYSDYLYTFISGHVPVQKARQCENAQGDWNVLKSFTHNNLINIDGGCVLGQNDEVHNGAIFFRLDDMKEYVLEMK